MYKCCYNNVHISCFPSHVAYFIKTQDLAVFGWVTSAYNHGLNFFSLHDSTPTGKITILKAI